MAALVCTPSISGVSHISISAIVCTWVLLGNDQRYARNAPFLDHNVPNKVKIQQSGKQKSSPVGIASHINAAPTILLMRLQYKHFSTSTCPRPERAWNLRGHMTDAAAANARVRNGHVRVRPIDIDRSRPAGSRDRLNTAAAREKHLHCRSSRVPDQWLKYTHTNTTDAILHTVRTNNQSLAWQIKT